MKFKNWYVAAILLAVTACGDDGEGEQPTFYYSVFNGELPTVNNEQQPAAGATIKVYATAQAWLDGDSPLKTMTVNSKGRIDTFDKFPSTAVVYAESGVYTNWPGFLTAGLNEDPNLVGTLAGGSSVYDSFFQLFEGVSGKSFLISDVLVNGVSVFNSVSACSKDNFLMLRRDANLVYNEGADVCVGKTALQEFPMNIFPKSQTTPVIINSTSFYRFTTSWAEVENYVYVKTDFTQVWFKTNDGNENIVIYTKQN
jgi:hypothetical protein